MTLEYFLKMAHSDCHTIVEVVFVERRGDCDCYEYFDCGSPSELLARTMEVAVTNASVVGWSDNPLEGCAKHIRLFVRKAEQ